jgi:hypothetical protein
VFGTLERIARMAVQARPNAVDAQVSDIMRRYWTTSPRPVAPTFPACHWAPFEWKSAASEPRETERAGEAASESACSYKGSSAFAEG